MKVFIKKFEIIVSLSLLLVSCSNSQTSVASTLLQPTTTSTPQTESPIVRPSTNTPVPTSTLQPPLSLEDASKLVAQLLRDNSNCRLPCWWGITPSKTTSQDTRSFLNSFSMIASTNSNRGDDGAVRLRVPNGDGLLYLTIEYDGNDAVISKLIVGVSQLALNEKREYEEEFGDPTFITVTESLALSEILNLYGQPDEILVATYSLQPLGMPVVFDIQLFYPKHGFLIAYKSLMEFSENQQVRGCPARSNIIMGLWESGKYDAMKDLPINFRENLSSYSLSTYLQIDKATGMSIQEFYDAFKNDRITCLETPSDLWPMPGQ